MVLEGMNAPEVLEVTTICEALSLASDLHATRVLIISDCPDVIKDLNSRNMFSSYGSILREIDKSKEIF